VHSSSTYFFSLYFYYVDKKTKNKKKMKKETGPEKLRTCHTSPSQDLNPASLQKASGMSSVTGWGLLLCFSIP
jgi:hypothetical protein